MEKCSKCGVDDRAPRQRWCKACRAKWMREHRKPKTPEQRARANARSYAKVYRNRGKLVAQPCEVCGEAEVEMHHDDYSKPLSVRWLCRKHHVELHYGN